MSRWTPVVGNLRSISVGYANVGSSSCFHAAWGINDSGEIFVRDFSDNAAWASVPGMLSRIAVSCSPTKAVRGTWGVTDNQQVYRLDYLEGGWTLMEGALCEIAVSELGVWGLNAMGELFHASPQQKNLTWNRVDGSLTRLAVSNTTVWGITKDYQIYYLKKHGAWQQIPGQLKMISANDKWICGVTPNGEVHYSHNMRTWFHLTDGIPRTFVYCSCDDRQVWALDAEGKIWVWGS